MFVPLIGDHGWSADEGASLRSSPSPEPRSFREPAR